ncbi:unnamed protein product [Sphagnum jensenii]|jgi:butyrate kinase
MEIERTHVKVNERFKTDQIVRSGTLFAYLGRVGRRERRREDEQEGEDKAMVRAMAFAVSAMGFGSYVGLLLQGQL